MEAKAHSHDTYKAVGQMSYHRIEQDLRDCSRDHVWLCKPVTQYFKKADHNDLHVCIVGAGFAGLRCAEVLLAQGVRVTILDARDRLGGRVHQADLGGHVVDMGPDWIHRSYNNPLFTLAQDTHGTLCFIEDNMKVFDQHGQEIDSGKATQYFDIVSDIINEASSYSNSECFRISSGTSLKDFFIEKVDQVVFDEEAKMVILQMAEMCGVFIGDPWEKQSLKYFWLEERSNGAKYFVASTHAKILERVAERATKEANICLNTKVLSVETIIQDHNRHRVLIQTESQWLGFDEVVVTVPLGCLKRGDIHFTPPLPTPFLNAIKNNTYSTLEKVYLTFPTAFWDRPNAASSPLSSFAHFLHPTYSSTNPESWTIELNTLSSPKIFGKNAQPTLLFTIYGPCAKHITSKINNLSPSSPEYHTLLTDFFRPYYSLLPNYDSKDPNCEPIAALATNWQNDSLAGNGSYMNFQVGEEEDGEGVGLDGDIRVLRKGIPEGGVWFAGEHAAPFAALGTVTGAYWSGEAVGVRILKARGLMEDSED